MYQLYKSGYSTEVTGAIRFNVDGSKTAFLFDPDNTDYQEFLRWCEAGNTPEPADQPE